MIIVLFKEKNIFLVHHHIYTKKGINDNDMVRLIKLNSHPSNLFHIHGMAWVM